MLSNALALLGYPTLLNFMVCVLLWQTYFGMRFNFFNDIEAFLFSFFSLVLLALVGVACVFFALYTIQTNECGRAVDVFMLNKLGQEGDGSITVDHGGGSTEEQLLTKKAMDYVKKPSYASNVLQTSEQMPDFVTANPELA